MIVVVLPTLTDKKFEMKTSEHYPLKLRLTQKIN